MIRIGNRGVSYPTCKECGQAYTLEFQHIPGHREHEEAYCKCGALLWEGSCTNVWITMIDAGEAK